MIARTRTRTYNAVRFADPYKVCNQCGAWIDGVLDGPERLTVIPCEHQSGYTDACPSWGPVDGCTCDAVLGHRPHPER